MLQLASGFQEKKENEHQKMIQFLAKDLKINYEFKINVKR
jgi:hypothetical protein